MGQHSIFAPSSAQRLIDCPASLAVNLALPDRESMDAIWGSCAHFVAETCLKENCQASDFEGVIVFYKDHDTTYEKRENAVEVVVDDDMISCVQQYVDWCRELPGDHFIEQRVDISRWCPDPATIKALLYRVFNAEPDDNFDYAQGGTSDHAACEPGLLTITDLKGGKGVQVFAENNPQAVLYALGFFDAWDWLYGFQRIVIRIAQPRLAHFDVWEIGRVELLDWGERIRSAFNEACAVDARYGPTEKACKFCKAAFKCCALAEATEKEHALAFDDLTGEFKDDLAFLTPSEIIAAWRKRKLYDTRMEAIEHTIMAALLTDDPAYAELKLVENNRVKRRWKGDTNVAIPNALRALGLGDDEIYTRKLNSPAQVEKLVFKPLRPMVSELVFKPPGKPSIVDASDPRPKYEAKNGVDPMVFDDLSDGDESD